MDMSLTPQLEARSSYDERVPDPTTRGNDAAAGRVRPLFDNVVELTAADLDQRHHPAEPLFHPRALH